MDQRRDHPTDGNGPAAEAAVSSRTLLVLAVIAAGALRAAWALRHGLAIEQEGVGVRPHRRESAGRPRLRRDLQQRDAAELPTALSHHDRRGVSAHRQHGMGGPGDQYRVRRRAGHSHVQDRGKAVRAEGRQCRGGPGGIPPRPDRRSSVDVRGGALPHGDDVRSVLADPMGDRPTAQREPYKRSSLRLRVWGCAPRPS